MHTAILKTEAYDLFGDRFEQRDMTHARQIVGDEMEQTRIIDHAIETIFAEVLIAVR